MDEVEGFSLFYKILSENIESRVLRAAGEQVLTSYFLKIFRRICRETQNACTQFWERGAL